MHLIFLSVSVCCVSAASMGQKEKKKDLSRTAVLAQSHPIHKPTNSFFLLFLCGVAVRLFIVVVLFFFIYIYRYKNKISYIVVAVVVISKTQTRHMSPRHGD